MKINFSIHTPTHWQFVKEKGIEAQISPFSIVGICHTPEKNYTHENCSMLKKKKDGLIICWMNWNCRHIEMISEDYCNLHNMRNLK